MAEKSKLTMEEMRAKSLELINNINQVEDFYPDSLAEEYALEEGKTIRKLPVRYRIGWFKLAHPNGRIRVEVKSSGGLHTATAYIYAERTDGIDEYLASGTSSRADNKDIKISALEWAQTAAIGVALRNAGFGLNYEINDTTVIEDTPEFSLGDFMKKKGLIEVVEDGGREEKPVAAKTTEAKPGKKTEEKVDSDNVPSLPESVTEEDYKKALDFVFTSGKYKGDSLASVLHENPGFIKFLAEKSTNGNGANECRIVLAYAKTSGGR